MYLDVGSWTESFTLLFPYKSSYSKGVNSQWKGASWEQMITTSWYVSACGWLAWPLVVHEWPWSRKGLGEAVPVTIIPYSHLVKHILLLSASALVCIWYVHSSTLNKAHSEGNSLLGTFHCLRWLTFHWVWLIYMQWKVKNTYMNITSTVDFRTAEI